MDYDFEYVLDEPGRLQGSEERVLKTRVISDLMSLAIDDIEKTATDGRTAISTNEWARRAVSLGSPLTAVCPAGAVMLQCGVEPGAPSALQRNGKISYTFMRRIEAVEAYRRGVFDARAWEVDFGAPPDTPGMEEIYALAADKENHFTRVRGTLTAEETAAAVSYWRRRIIPALQRAGL